MYSAILWNSNIMVMVLYFDLNKKRWKNHSKYSSNPWTPRVRDMCSNVIGQQQSCTFHHEFKDARHLAIKSWIKWKQSWIKIIKWFWNLFLMIGWIILMTQCRMWNVSMLSTIMIQSIIKNVFENSSMIFINFMISAIWCHLNVQVGRGINCYRQVSISWKIKFDWASIC